VWNRPDISYPYEWPQPELILHPLIASNLVTPPGGRGVGGAVTFDIFCFPGPTTVKESIPVNYGVPFASFCCGYLGVNIMHCVNYSTFPTYPFLGSHALLVLTSDIGGMCGATLLCALPIY